MTPHQGTSVVRLAPGIGAAVEHKKVGGDPQETAAFVGEIHCEGVSAYVADLVVTPEDHHVIYLSMAGPTESIRAIYVGLRTDRLVDFVPQGVVIDAEMDPGDPQSEPGAGGTRNNVLTVGATPSADYKRFKHEISGGLEHWILVHPKACCRHVEEGSKFYLVVGGRTDREELLLRFIGRVGRVPVLPEWKSQLWKQMRRVQMITDLESHGRTQGFAVAGLKDLEKLCGDIVRLERRRKSPVTETPGRGEELKRAA